MTVDGNLFRFGFTPESVVCSYFLKSRVKESTAVLVQGLDDRLKRLCSTREILISEQK